MRQMKNHSHHIRIDCIFYKNTYNKPVCGALRKLDCGADGDSCHFYKPTAQYNRDGSKKIGGKSSEKI